MSFPKLNDFIGKELSKAKYKRVSLIHSIKNTLARNTIVESCQDKYRPNHNPLQSTQKSNSLSESLKKLQPPASFMYQQKMPTSFDFSTEDLYKLLEHLFNKKQHDLNDRNFIRRLMLKYFPQELICSGKRDLVSLLKFDKLRKGERKIFDKGSRNKQQRKQNHEKSKYVQSRQRNFYFILKGKVAVFTEQFKYRKVSGEYFGQLQILGEQKILQIQAKSDTMFLTLSEQIFNTNLAQYFIDIYADIRKKISLFEPILNLAPTYNQYKFLQLLYEKDYKTGDKVYQKGDQITDIVFLNHAQISSTQDKLLNGFRAVGLGQLLGVQKPKARQTTYCMDNKTVYAIKANDLSTFINKDIILSFISQKYNSGTLSASNISPNIEDKSSHSQSNVKMDTFVDIKRVRFTGNKRRILTEPNLSISMSSPKSSKQTPSYPEYATSFVFIKQNSSTCFAQMKCNRLKSLTKETPKKTDFREYLFKTRDSFKKKRWLDEIDKTNENSIICNPQKLAKYETIRRTQQIKQFKSES